MEKEICYGNNFLRKEESTENCYSTNGLILALVCSMFNNLYFLTSII